MFTPPIIIVIVRMVKSNITNNEAIMKYEDIQKALTAPGFSVMDCCRKTGIHMNSVYNIRTGRTKKPNPLTVEALEKYLNKQAKVDAEG